MTAVKKPETAPETVTLISLVKLDVATGSRTEHAGIPLDDFMENIEYLIEMKVNEALKKSNTV